MKDQCSPEYKGEFLENERQVAGSQRTKDGSNASYMNPHILNMCTWRAALKLFLHSSVQHLSTLNPSYCHLNGQGLSQGLRCTVWPLATIAGTRQVFQRARHCQTHSMGTLSHMSSEMMHDRHCERVHRGSKLVQEGYFQPAYLLQVLT